MNNIADQQLSNSVKCDGDLAIRRRPAHAVVTGLHGHRRRSTRGSARRNLLGAALAAAALFGGIAGGGVIGIAGEASAKPMEREHARYCAKLQKDYDFTRKAFLEASKKYGNEDALTLQAASNYERAHSKLTTSSC